MLMKEIKLEGIIYKIKLVNQLTMIFHKVNLAKQSVYLIQCGPILSFNLAPPDLNFWLRHCDCVCCLILGEIASWPCTPSRTRL